VKWFHKREEGVAYIREVASIMPLFELVEEKLGLVRSPDSSKQPLLVLKEGGGQPLHHGGTILCSWSLFPEGQDLSLVRGGGGGCGGGGGGSGGRLGGARGNLLQLGHGK